MMALALLGKLPFTFGALKKSIILKLYCCSVPRPVFFAKKGTVQTKFQHNNCNEGSFSPHHLEIVNFINECE